MPPVEQLPCCNQEIISEHKGTKSTSLEPKYWFEPRTLSFSIDYFGFSRPRAESIGLGFSYATQELSALWFLGSPSLELGAMINTEFGNKISHVYAGFTWDIFLSDDIFLSLDFGGMLHNGNHNPSTTKIDYGSKLLFREQIGIGYQFYEEDDYSLDGKVSIGHASHAGLGGSSNPGINFLSFEVQYRFN